MGLGLYADQLTEVGRNDEADVARREASDIRSSLDSDPGGAVAATPNNITYSGGSFGGH
jgi:hypothetical protein